jgi:hypothetical protein
MKGERQKGNEGGYRIYKARRPNNMQGLKHSTFPELLKHKTEGLWFKESMFLLVSPKVAMTFGSEWLLQLHSWLSGTQSFHEHLL